MEEIKRAGLEDLNLNDGSVRRHQKGEENTEHNQLEGIDHSPQILESRCKYQTQEEIASHDRLDRLCEGVLQKFDLFWLFETLGLQSR